MRILHTSDWHVGRTIRGRSRLDEHVAVLAEIADIAATETVDLVLVAGDLFDVAAPTPESERVVYQALLALSEVAPVAVVAGNHDHPRRLQAVAPLLELGRVHVGAFLDRPDQGVVSPLEGVKVALVPFTSQRAIVKAEQLMSDDPGDHAADYEARMRRVIDSLTAGMGVDTVNLVVGHLTVHGAQGVGSERQAHIFGYGIAAQSFPGHLSYVALGHFHRQQKVAASAPVWYSGSPLQLDFGEAGEAKGVLLVDAEPGAPARVRNVPLEVGRRLVKLRGTLEQVAGAASESDAAFFQVELDEVARSGLAEEVLRLIPNAVDVRIVAERVPGQADVVAPRLGRQPRELFVEYLKHRSIEDERLVALFEELLEEAYEA